MLMKKIKLLLLLMIPLLFYTSCSVDVVAGDGVVVVDPPVSLEQVLASHELWYVDIHQTTGPGEIPFLQKAFTVSFLNGTMYANNNLVGIGAAGSGFGIDVGYYNTFNGVLEVQHDLDGYWDLEVYTVNPNRLRIYDRYSNTSYYLIGYQRSTFDYDWVFYDNIHYFLQEYVTWERIYISPQGDTSAFDAENYLQFIAGGSGINFRSSQDNFGTPIDNIYWDYSGIYDVQNVYGNDYLKTLTLDYDYFGNEYFELSIINDSEIELFSPYTGTTHAFRGRGFIQFKNSEKQKHKKRVKRKNKVRYLEK